jgi:CheY-like chemotaxis protein
LRGGLETILVVDDEEDVRSATCGILSALGYRVLEACDAAGAVDLIESGEQIDLVFTDVIMPGPVSSLQLRDVLRAHLPEAQILYTSGYAEGVLAHSGKLDASVHLLQKPYHPERRAHASVARPQPNTHAPPAARTLIPLLQHTVRYVR